MKPIYFLHVPRCGGTSIVNNLVLLFGNPHYTHKNGNPITEYGDWYPFWKDSLQAQLDLVGESRFICNERRIGEIFNPSAFRYLVCVRDPVQQRLSIVSYTLGEFYNFKDIRDVPSSLIHEVFRDSYNRFPSNLFTWMLASLADSCAVREYDLKVAIDRLRLFEVLKLDSLESDFERCMNAPYCKNLIKQNSSKLKISINDLCENDKEELFASIQLDKILLASISRPISYT